MDSTMKVVEGFHQGCVRRRPSRCRLLYAPKTFLILRGATFARHLRTFTWGQ